jgi:chromosome segregation ATPase
MSETTPAELLTPANEASTRDLIQRLRELVFTFAGPAPGETMGIFSDRDVQDTFKCLQAAADYLQRFFEREAAHAQAITALHEQLEFQRKRADDRVAAYERQSLELEKIREYGGDELNTWEATDAQLRTLQAEKESDAWHQGWNVAVHERDQARQAITALQSDKTNLVYANEAWRQQCEATDAQLRTVQAERDTAREHRENLIRDIQAEFGARFTAVVDEAYGDISVNTAFRVALRDEREAARVQVEELTAQLRTVQDELAGSADAYLEQGQELQHHIDENERLKAQLRMVGQALRDLSVRLRREHEQAGDPIERDTAFYCADELDALIQTLEPPA